MQIRPLEITLFASLTGLVVLAGAGCSTAGAYWQGNDRLARGDYNGAVEALTLAIQEDPSNFGALLNRGLAHEKLGQPDEAIRDFDRAIELVPTFGMAYHDRGHIYAAREQYERAIEDYDMALRHADAVQIDAHGQVLATDKSAVSYDRGNSFFKLNRFPQAIESYNQAIELAPKFAAAYNNRGVVKWQLGDKDAACRDRSRACELGYSPACDWVKENCR